MWRLPFFLLSYILFMLCVEIPSIILGWVLIPVHAVLHKYTTKQEVSIINGSTITNWKAKYMFIWSNQEDGITAGSEYKDKPLWFKIIYWSAYRNPANNLRFVPKLTLKLDPTKIKFVLSKLTAFDANSYPLGRLDNLKYYDRDDYLFTTLIWQGLYSNFRIQFRMFGKNWRFWIGFKIYPEDVLGISSHDYRIHGAGFATQLKVIYPRENK